MLGPSWKKLSVRSLPRQTLPLVMSLAIVGVPLHACAAEAVTPKSPDRVSTTPAQMQQIDVVTSQEGAFFPQKAAFGQIAFNEDASTTVSTPFSGRVTRVIGKPGDHVKRGDPLFEIDSPEVMQAHTDLIAAAQVVEKQRVQLSLAKRVLDRLSSLLAGNATSQRELDQARSDHASAEADLAAAQSALLAARNRLRVILGRDEADIQHIERDRTARPLITINAPIDGTIIARKIGPGQYVRADAAEPLYTIADLSTMWLKAFVAESDIPFVREGQELEVRVSALPDRIFRARVIAIAAASDPQTRRVVVRSEIPNTDSLLRAEMFATFKISLAQAEKGPVLPTRAIIREADKASVWVETAPHKFSRREVETSIEQGGQVIISKGLKVGERVVVRGAIFIDNEAKQ